MPRAAQLSIVIPVFNGSGTLERLVDEIHSVFQGRPFELVLVNDGSTDDSERTCQAIAGKFHGTVLFAQLARNFGEHSAVLAGMSRSTGEYVGILDDDGQNPPQELLRLWQHICDTGADVVYGRHISKEHGWFRNMGSRLNGLFATTFIGKPRNIYLSSFKVLSRPLVEELLKYRGPFPYLDALICRSTSRIRQIDVVHRPREIGRSGYTLAKLTALWLNMCLGYSVVPMRLICAVGALMTLAGTLLLCGMVIESVWPSPRLPVAASVMFAAALALCGVQLVAIGIVGEYAGRILMHQSGMSPFVIRYVQGGPTAGE
jgi:undecaprenyl-phosphate 4-deoxy-4-formamido-L-arabinose transferase